MPLCRGHYHLVEIAFIEWAKCLEAELPLVFTLQMLFMVLRWRTELFSLRAFPVLHMCTDTQTHTRTQTMTSWTHQAMRDDVIVILLTLVIKAGFAASHEHPSFIKLPLSLARWHTIRAVGSSKYSSIVQLQTESVDNIQASFNCLLAL